jgi:hypothetical protein
LIKVADHLYLNDTEDKALVQLKNGEWVVISKDGLELIYGPDLSFESAKLYLQIMNEDSEV